MRAGLTSRQQIAQISGFLVRALDDLVGAINTPPVCVGKANIHSGTGSPEGRILGTVGDLYLRTDGSTSTTFYVKEAGKQTRDNWVAK